MESNKWLSDKIGIDAVLAFVFGVTFVLALLILTVAIPNPTPSQEQTFRIVMSLAAAGIASVIPGMLNISASGGKRFTLRAAGALAGSISGWERWNKRRRGSSVWSSCSRLTPVLASALLTGSPSKRCPKTLSSSVGLAGSAMSGI